RALLFGKPLPPLLGRAHLAGQRVSPSRVHQARTLSDASAPDRRVAGGAGGDAVAMAVAPRPRHGVGDSRAARRAREGPDLPDVRGSLARDHAPRAARPALLL